MELESLKLLYNQILESKNNVEQQFNNGDIENYHDRIINYYKGMKLILDLTTQIIKNHINNEEIEIINNMKIAIKKKKEMSKTVN